MVAILYSQAFTGFQPDRKLCAAPSRYRIEKHQDGVTWPDFSLEQDISGEVGYL